MNITIAPNLSGVLAIRDDGYWLQLAGHNPETMLAWTSETQIEDYVNSIASRVGWWAAPTVPYEAATDVPSVISRRQFLGALWLAGKITLEEATQAAGAGIMPAAIEGFLLMLEGNGTPEEMQIVGLARLHLSSSVDFQRNHYLVPVFGSLFNMTTEQIDQLWITGATLN